MIISARRVGVLTCALVVLACASVASALNAGDTAPDVHAPSVLSGKIVDFDLHKALTKNAVVLYFFPKAFTQG